MGAAAQASESISYLKMFNDYGTETKSLLKDGIGGIFTSARHPDILLFTSSEGRKSHLFFESGSYSTMYLDILKFERKSAVTGEVSMGELTDMASSVWVLTPENQEVYDDYMLFLQEP
jgi:hypothetical protein